MQVGLLAPEQHATGRLLTGQVGYIIAGIKDLKGARVGDTLHEARVREGGRSGCMHACGGLARRGGG